jgi:PHP domain
VWRPRHPPGVELERETGGPAAVRADPGAARRLLPRGRLAAIGLVVAVLGGGYAGVARLGPLPAPPGWPPTSDLAEYTAVLHVHSRYSHDGRGTVEEIAAAAARARARVVFLTDHNTLAPLKDGKEAWYGPTLVLVGTEVTTSAGYLLLLDPDPNAPVQQRGVDFAAVFQRYRQAESIVLLAHPDHPRLGWRQDALPPVDGIEVVDVFDQVVAAPVQRQMLGLLAYPANPVMAILSVVHWPRRVLESWDRLARERPTIGVLGLDAHGGIELTEETGVRFPSHETAFRLGQLHFVTPEALGHDEADRTRVYRSLRAGRFYNAFDGLAPAAGFRFEARRGSPPEGRDAMRAGGPPRPGETQVALMGDTLRSGEGWTFEVRVPPVGETAVRLLRDGVVVHEAPGPGPIRIPADAAGVYRVEVDVGVNLFPITTARRMPWIFSNPIYVRP